MDGDGKTGWVKLFHPRGVQCTLPVTAERQDYAALLANVGAMLDAGWLVAAPGLDAGEHKDEIGYVVVRSKDNDDGTATPIVDLYPADEAMKFSVLSVYLNRPADEEAFEYAAGVKLDALQPYVGAGKLERGASKQTDRLVHKVPRPFGVVFKDNPKYDPNETDAKKKKPKRVFVRWADQKPPAPAGTPAGDNTPAPQTPADRAHPAPGTNKAEAQKQQPAPPAPPAPPATGAELHARLKTFDGKHAGELWPTGHLLAHVVERGVKAGYGADIARWQGAAVKFGMDTAIDYYTAATKAQNAPAR